VITVSEEKLLKYRNKAWICTRGWLLQAELCGKMVGFSSWGYDRIVKNNRSIQNYRRTKKSKRGPKDQMIGLGTIINTVAVIAGGLIGHFTGGMFKQEQQEALNRVCGVSVLFIAIAGAMEGMLTVDGATITSGKAMLVMLCLTIGALISALAVLKYAQVNQKVDMVYSLNGQRRLPPLPVFIIQHFRSLPCTQK
jgi:hypothetical protein